MIVVATAAGRAVRRSSSIFGPIGGTTGLLRLRLGSEQRLAAYSSRIPVGRASRLPPRKRHTSAFDASSVDERSTHVSRQHGTDDSVSSAGLRQVQLSEQASVPNVQRDTVDDALMSSEDVRTSVESIVGQPTLIVTRQIEMLNVFLGYEQANKYALVSPDGQSIGYLAESESGLMGGAMRRQFLRTHRAFEAQVLDVHGRVVMTFARPTTLVNSRLKVYVGVGDQARLVGEVHQIWHLYRRKYELFVNRPERNAEGQLEDSMVQFASIDGALLTWDFILTDENDRPLGAITRNFRGFGRELFTDTGQYVLTFDPTSSPELRLDEPAQPSSQSKTDEEKNPLRSSSSGRELVISGPVRALSTEERAVAMATAVSIDFDYFSRHSNAHGTTGMPMFPFIWGSGGSGEAPPPNEAPVPGAEGGADAGQTMPPSSSSPSSQQTTDERSDYPPFPTADESNESPSSSSPQEQPWWGNVEQPSEGQDFGQGQEDVWGGGAQDPWQDSSQSPLSGGGDGGGGGWSWTDFLPGGGDDS